LLQILHNALTTVPSDTKYRKSRVAYPCCGTKARHILNAFSDLGLVVNEYRFVEEVHSETADSLSALNALWFVVTKSGTAGTLFLGVLRFPYYYYSTSASYISFICYRH